MEIFTGKRMVDHLVGMQTRGVDIGFAFFLFPPQAGLEDEVRLHAPAHMAEAIINNLTKVRQAWKGR